MPRLVLDKPALFERLGYVPHPGQKLVHDSAAKRRVVACGVRWGKTVCAAMEAVAATLEPVEHTSYGWVVAPTYDLAQKVFREIMHVLLTKMRHRVIKYSEHDRYIRVLNFAGQIAEVRAKTADSPVSLLGEALHWMVLDEAARVRSDIWERYLSARLVDHAGWGLLISSPKGKGWFYEEWRKGQRKEHGFESWNSPSSANPILPRQELESVRARLPESIYRQEYLAEFIEGSGAVFRNVRDLATCEWRAPEPGQQYVAGLDLAKTVDWTVLVVMNRAREVVHVDRFQRVDWDIQVGRIKETTERYNRCEVLVDSTGKGEPIFEALVKGGLRARAYPFTHSSKQDLVNNLAIMCEKKMVRFPRVELWPEGIEELEAFQYSVLPSGVVKTGAPEGQHDDCAVAVMLAAWNLRRDAAPMRVTWV